MNRNQQDYHKNKYNDPEVSRIVKRNYKNVSVDDEYDELAGPSKKSIDVDVKNPPQRHIFT